LSGRRIDSLDAARDAARRIRDLGPRAVIITGGHVAFDRGAGAAPDVVDLLLDGDAWHELAVARVDTGATHGTGCAFASALAAGLALGRPLPAAAEDAQRYVARALAHRLAIGHGRAPLDHFWQTTRILES
jgi:hydroxymethylpyrimidine/phosphomethylpyrimidine kinase